MSKMILTKNSPEYSRQRMVAGGEAPPFTDLERSLLALSIALFSLLATFGNFLLWVSILCNKSLQRISNLFIFNLSLTDMIVGKCNNRTGKIKVK